MMDRKHTRYSVGDIVSFSTDSLVTKKGEIKKIYSYTGDKLFFTIHTEYNSYTKQAYEIKEIVESGESKN